MVKDAVFTTSDIKDFFYVPFLPDPEYMKMKLKMIPREIIDQYHLQDLQENGWVYMKIVKGMAGLKQAARLANERLMNSAPPSAIWICTSSTHFVLMET